MLMAVVGLGRCSVTGGEQSNGPRSIGTALPNVHISATKETNVFEHPPSGAGRAGYLSHFWVTGAAVQQDAIVRIYVDHEAVASVE